MEDLFPEWRRSFLYLVVGLVVMFLMAGMIMATNDLPVHPPKFRGANKGPGVPQPYETPVEEDPRDVPAPIFFGEEIEATDSIVYVLDKSLTMNAGVSGMQVWRHDNGRRMVAWAFGSQTFGSTKKGLGPEGANRWERAVAETYKSLQALSPNFKFEVIAYDYSVLPCFGGLVEATPGNRAKALAWLLTFYPEGGTCSAPAVVAALDLKPDAVAFLSDGTPECGYIPAKTNEEARWKHRMLIRNANPKPIPIKCFGIGLMPWFGARRFMQGVAHDSGGQYVDVQ